MADTKTPGSGTKSDAKANEPKWYKVRSSHRQDGGRILFRSVSEQRARNHIETRFPRGSEAHLEMPDGSFEHYEAERQGEHGQDADAWGPFDPEGWKPPAEQEPPGQSQWGDVEG